MRISLGLLPRFSFLFLVSGISFSAEAIDQPTSKHLLGQLGENDKLFEVLANQCSSTIYLGDAEIQFRAVPNGQLVVGIDEDFNPASLDELDVQIVEQHISTLSNDFPGGDKLPNHIIIQLPGENERDAISAFTGIEAMKGIKWVDVHCVSKLDLDSNNITKACEGSVSTSFKASTQPARPNPVKSAIRCECKIRERLGFFEVVQVNDLKNPPVVAVLDDGFYPNEGIFKNSLAKFEVNLGENNTRKKISYWNYCTNSSHKTQGKHGVEVASILAGECATEDCFPGASESARMLLFQVLSDTEKFASYTAIAQAIYDAVDLGAKIINLSFVLKKNTPCLKYDSYGKCDKPDGLNPIREAIKNSDSIIFVAGSQLDNSNSQNPTFPAGFNYSNVFALQAASWGDRTGSDLTPTTEIDNWCDRLDLAAPDDIRAHAEANAGTGISNGIALVSGSIANLISRESCKNLTPKQIIDLFKKHSRKNWNSTCRDDCSKPSNRSGGYLDLRFLAKERYESLSQECAALAGTN